VDAKFDAAAELPEVTDLVKSFQTAGDLDGSGYALPRFYEDRVPSKTNSQIFRRISAGREKERTMRSVGTWITYGETRRDGDGCILAPRKMLKDVGKGDRLDL